MTEYRQLAEGDISRDLFSGFIRRQVVTMCWRKTGEGWCIREDPFIDDWSEDEYAKLVCCLKNTVGTGGFVYAAFRGGILKGFASVEPGLFGGENRYLDLSSLHVSEDMRGQGLGKALFCAAAEWAGSRGAEKLYISGHSAVETQGFYRAMGCVEAAEYNRKHVEEEPYDCQLEYRIRRQ